MTKTTQNEYIARPPVVAVMGHIDHGKSSLLDYIRKTNVVAGEAGGITQHISAYEAVVKREDGGNQTITFLDTPGHAAFQAMRSRGAAVADIAILIVSAEDGVKPQTIEAMQTIVASGIPYIVAINKIDKPNANLERTKQSLAENEIFVEGYGGSISVVPISAKTGQGVDELLNMILLTADLAELKANPNVSAKGIIIESSRDPKRGITASVIIKDGTLKTGECVSAGNAICPVRFIESYDGSSIKSATFSNPIRLTGWSEIPPVGSEMVSCDSKADAEAVALKFDNTNAFVMKNDDRFPTDTPVMHVIVKTDVAGTGDAVLSEIQKLGSERLYPKVVVCGTGNISENDVKAASALPGTVIVGFNVKVDPRAEDMARQNGVTIELFSVIYKLTEKLEELLTARTPKITVEEATGTVKLLKIFNHEKDRQVVGGSMVEGVIKSGDRFKILRRESEIGRGQFIELQQNKIKTRELSEGDCGMLVEAKISLAPGDRLESFSLIEK